MLNRDQAKAITDRVLSLSKAEEASINLSGGTTSHLRFARNTPSTSGSNEAPSLQIDSTFGKRTGSVTINQFDQDSLARGVARSEEIARLAPEDPEHMPILAPQRYVETPGYSSGTAERGAENLANWAATCIDDARSSGLVSAGFSQTTAGYSCIANSRGLFGYHRATGAYLSETVRTNDGTGSGWASASSHQMEDIDAGVVSKTAMAKARASAQPKPLEPGKYVTILEPACVANLVRMMGWFMNARSADEGRSYFSSSSGGNRLGEKLFDERVNIYSDPMDPMAPGAPWGQDGLPQERRAWIENGVLKHLMTGRYWAQKSGVAPVPFPSNLIMQGGSGTVDDLIASTERGVLVTSLWYIRPVDPRTMLFTGITRDGVFWVENGKIKHPVQNLRWNDSPLTLLSKLDSMSATVRVPPRPWRSSDTAVPALRVKEFHFTSVSEAV